MVDFIVAHALYSIQLLKTFYGEFHRKPFTTFNHRMSLGLMVHVLHATDDIWVVSRPEMHDSL